MKAILGVAAVVTWLARCHDIELPHAYHGHEHPHSDAGSEPASDAGTVAASDGGDEPSRPGDCDAAIVPQQVPCTGPPAMYVPGSCTQLAAGLRAYRPHYELWSDGASKERYIFLPPGTQVDTTDPDRWTFPQGTRIYKTFLLEGLRIETRVLEKVAAAAGIDSWTLIAYAWSADQLSASPADPNGVTDALGTSHDIPAQTQCKSCHQMPELDAVNGFGAIQLNHRDAGFTLAELLARGLLVNGVGAPNVSLAAARLPGDAVAQAALGYLHANCGNCHGGPMPRAGFALSSVIGTWRVADASAYRAADECQCLTRWTGRTDAADEAYTLRIAPGRAADSAVIARMSVRGMGEQMPPIGTSVVDTVAVAAVSAWIDALDPTLCDAATVCVAPVSM